MKELVIRFTGKTDLAPHYASTEAAGADLKADLEENLEIIRQVLLMLIIEEKLKLYL
jgi:hypothetical protein